MKNFKRNTAFGALEYTLIIASVIIISLIGSKAILAKMKESSAKNLSPIESAGPFIENAVDSTKITVSLNEMDELIYEYDSNMLNKEDLIKNDFKNYIINDVLKNKKLVLDNTTSYNKENYEVRDIFLVVEDDVLRFIQFRLYDKNKGTSSDNISARAVDTYIRKIYIDAHDNEHYSDEDGFSGVLEKYLYSGELIEEHTKFITDYHSANYNQDGYIGTLTQYTASGHAAGSKAVTEPANLSSPATKLYSDADGYSGTLTRTQTGGLAADTQYVTNQLSANYNSGGYIGTLTQYVASGSFTPADTIYVTNQTSANYNVNGYSGTLNSYVISGSYTPSRQEYHEAYDFHTSVFSSKTIYVHGRHYALPLVHSKYAGDGFYDMKFAGYITIPAVDTRVYRYQGNVTKPASDTRVYRYQGNVSRPETRTFEYRGTVSRPDTRVFRYEGNVTRPEIDTRVYKYRGYVTR